MAFLVPVVASIGSALGSALGGTAAAGAAATGATAAAAATGSTFSLGTALTVGSTLLGTFGALQQGKAASDAAKYNAEIQRQQAAQEEANAAARATEQGTRTRQKVAATRAAAVQSGLELDGSVADILDVVETQGALEGLTSLYEGTLKARGLRASAALNDSNARNSRTAGFIGAGTSLLTGASKLYG